MDLGIRDRVALVSAGTSGLGLAAATALAAEGVSVSICGRDPDRLAEARDAVAKVGDGRVLASEVDIRDGTAIEGWVTRTVEEFGGAHIVVANSGGPRPGRLDEIGPADYPDAFAACVQPQIALTYAALPHLRAAEWGRVLLVASETVRQPILHYGLSGTVRPALAGFARTLVHTLGPVGITVNVIAPGYHRTPGLERMLGADAEVEIDRIAGTVPVGRMGRPADFGAVAAFLASEPAGFISGTCLLVDGGMTRGTG
jgi:3-oxoacyl-[acyl-carrier protein] reductase